MPARPWFAFYPSDWRGDTKLRSCSPVSRLIWLEMMGIAHEAEPYGYVLIAGRQVAPEQLATIAAVTVRQARVALVELEAAGVFSRNGLGVPYSRRMVRDETTRLKRAAGGKDSLDNPNVPRPKDRSKDTIEDILRPVLQGHPHIPETRDQSSSLLAEFPDKGHRDAVATALGGQHPQAVEYTIRGLHDGTHRAYPYAVIGRALAELQAAGTTFSARALDAFCRSIQAGDPPPRERSGPRLTQREKNLAVLDAELAKCNAEEAA